MHHIPLDGLWLAWSHAVVEACGGASWSLQLSSTATGGAHVVTFGIYLYGSGQKPPDSLTPYTKLQRRKHQNQGTPCPVFKSLDWLLQ